MQCSSSDLEWVIILSDLSTYSNRDGPWERAPSRDVQAVLFRDRTLGWTIRHGGTGRSSCDFFRLDADGSVVGMDFGGMLDHVLNEWGGIKQGRMLSREHWDRVLAHAMRVRNELRAAENGAT